MREIEYRAWIDDEDMCNSEELPNHLDENGKFIPFMQNLNNWFMDDGQTLGDFLSNFKGNLMQYTGIKDIHGVKIFEGDIVKYEGSMLGRVYYDEAETSYILEPMNKKSSYEVLGLSCGLEIIGDIHENPELEEEL